MAKRNTYDGYFKLQAVKRIEDGEISVAALARRLGIHRNLLYAWRKRYREDGAGAFVEEEERPPTAEELRQLRRELTRLRDERDTYKRALELFIRDGGG